MAFTKSKHNNYGVLKNHYRTDELERCRSLSTDEGWGNDETITLREAARRFNRREGEVSVQQAILMRECYLN